MATKSFAEGIAWLAQIGLFVMLGLLLSPSRIDLHTVVQALVTGLVLTVVARPLSVLVSSVVQPMAPARPGLHLVGRPARCGPIVLATIPLSKGVEGADELFDIVFVMVVVYTLLTGPTLPGSPGCWGWRAGPSRAGSTSRRRRSTGSPPTCCR